MKRMALYMNRTNISSATLLDLAQNGVSFQTQGVGGRTLLEMLINDRRWDLLEVIAPFMDLMQHNQGLRPLDYYRYSVPYNEQTSHMMALLTPKFVPSLAKSSFEPPRFEPPSVARTCVDMMQGTRGLFLTEKERNIWAYPGTTSNGIQFVW